METNTSPDDRMSRIGWFVFFGLAVLTVIEYMIGVWVSPALPYLILTAVVKSALIVVFFMHIHQIREREAGHE